MFVNGNFPGNDVVQVLTCKQVITIFMKSSNTFLCLLPEIFHILYNPIRIHWMNEVTTSLIFIQISGEREEILKTESAVKHWTGFSQPWNSISILVTFSLEEYQFEPEAHPLLFRLLLSMDETVDHAKALILISKN